MRLFGWIVFALTGLLLGLPFIAASNEDTLFPQFMNYVQTYQKQYKSVEEFVLRFAYFRDTLLRIAKLNNDNGGAVFGINQFADMSPEEFKAAYLGFKPNLANYPRHIKVKKPYLAANVTSFDWRDKGAVTPVKDQQQCGSCWAFSAAEEIESMWFLSKNQLLQLSTQQIVSCDTVDLGCDGGDTPSAYQYVKKAGGLEKDSDYPYTSGGGVTGTCKVNKAKEIAKITGFTYATTPCQDSCNKQDETALANNLVSTGPVSICVSADVWQSYTGGILKSNCPHAYSSLDHCVQLVGFNDSGATPYWIIRNSWGKAWGEAGYIYVQKGKNLCGVADEATFVEI